MLLSEYFEKGMVERESEFLETMPVYSRREKSICYLGHKKFSEEINQNKDISAVITTPELKQYISSDKGLVICVNPAHEYYQLHNFLVDNNLMVPLIKERYISPSAQIHRTAQIADRVFIGDNVKIDAYVVIENDTIIETGTYLAHNVVIGAKGMQNVRLKDKSFGIRYFGGVKIGSHCEVLTNAIIQKPYQKFFTEIGSYTQISVKTSIGHGAVIGNNSQLAGNVTVAGNAKIGDNVWIGPSSTIADDVVVESNSKILIGSVVVNRVTSNTTVSGNFAQHHSQQLKNFAKIKRI